MKTVADAIKELNSDAVFKTSSLSLNSDAKDTTITWLEDTPVISSTDIQNKLDDLREQEITEQKNKETKKASGKQKLKDLGLDDDEINALIGG
tara:strand:+ start:630 stop:908 length:279 start_codon:yes stop_codon:yes gene_type:complete